MQLLPLNVGNAGLIWQYSKGGMVQVRMHAESKSLWQMALCGCFPDRYAPGLSACHAVLVAITAA